MNDNIINNNRFVVGDIVILKDARDCYTAELNKKYTIYSTKIKYNGQQAIELAEIKTDFEDIIYFDSRRFIKNTKEIRKLKLKKLYEKG